MEPETQVEVLEDLQPDRAADILEEMGPDDAADLVADLPDTTREEILALMEQEEAAEVQELLAYPEESAGGIMTTEFIAVPATLTAAQAIDRLRELEPDAETIYYVYVVDEDEKLVGVLSLRDLIVAKPDTVIRDVMIDEPITVARPRRPGPRRRRHRPVQPAGRAGRRRRAAISRASSPSTTRSTRSRPAAWRRAGGSPGRRVTSPSARPVSAARRRRLGRRARFARRPWPCSGPGIVSGFADNDAGGITTYSVAGARFGYDLLWVLLRPRSRCSSPRRSARAWAWPPARA